MNFYDKAQLDIATNTVGHEANQSVEDVLLHLALCHSIIIDKRTGKYNSASPDEAALVEGVAEQGFVFVNRDSEGLITIRRKRDDTTMQFQLLNIL